ncbi:hypothetical protein EBZ37_14380, partial [bacterium]|nr:hypothetical protein [bacterium]
QTARSTPVEPTSTPPEWDYSSWKPRSFVFTQLTLPLGGSVYELQNPGDRWGLEARGRGLTQLGMGVLFIKGWTHWDASLSFEAHRPLSRSFSTEKDLQSLEVRPSWGTSLGLSLGFSPESTPLRFGFSLSPQYEGSIRTRIGSDLFNVSEPQILWNSTLQASWLMNPSSTLTTAYNDQTWFGPAQNVALNRSVAFLLQKRWER